MPSATVKQESDYKFPEGVLFTGRLESVKDKRTPFTYKDHHAAVKNGRKRAGEQGEVHKWIWEFKILNEGEWYNDSLYLETDPEITTRSGDKVREIAETLLGREVAIGEDFNTDTILALPCRFTARHEEPRVRSDGQGTFYGCAIQDVFPVETAGATDTPQF